MDKHTFGTGCYFDGARGRYIGEAVQGLAHEHGWKELPVEADHEHYGDLWDEAEAFLQELAPEGTYFGSNEGGDWGLWITEEDEDHE